MTRASAEGGVEPIVGQWAVFRASYCYDVGQITKVTAKTISYLGLIWDGSLSSCEGRRERSGVVFAGSETASKLLLEQLRSSRAKYNEDQRQAGIRRNERDAKLIAEAKGEQP